MNQFRFTSLIPLIAMAALAGITWWLLQATAPPPEPKPEIKEEPAVVEAKIELPPVPPKPVGPRSKPRPAAP